MFFLSIVSLLLYILSVSMRKNYRIQKIYRQEIETIRIEKELDKAEALKRCLDNPDLQELRNEKLN